MNRTDGKRVVDVSVVDVEEGCKDFPPDGLLDLIAWFERAAATIPPEHRAAAKCFIRGTSYQGDATAEIAITYERPMTAEEIAAAEAQAENFEAMRRGYQRREYERLKKLFGP